MTIISSGKMGSVANKLKCVKFVNMQGTQFRLHCLVSDAKY